MINPFSVLGVSPNASKDEIRKAYISLVKQHHPDHNSTQGDDSRMKLINQAWDMLKNAPDRPKTQDETSYHHGANWQKYNIKPVVNVSATISLLQAYLGTMIAIPYGEETFYVSTPAGIANGMRLRMEIGPVDAYILVTISDHPRFIRRGQDLYAEVKMTALEAMSKKELVFKHIDDTPITIAFNNSSEIVIKGGGMPPFGARGAGNLYIIPNISFPDLTFEQEKLVKQMVELEMQKGLKTT